MNTRNTGLVESGRNTIRDFCIIGGLLLVAAIGYTAIYMTGRSSPADLGGQSSGSLSESAGGSNDILQLVDTGNQLMDSGRYDEAILHYSRALLLDSTLVDVRVDRGTSYFSLGRYREAISDFTVAVNSHPNHATAHFNLGIVYSTLGHDSIAVAYWERCLELQPEGDIAERAKQLLEKHGE